MTARVMMASLWRNDTQRLLAERVMHLLEKAEAWPNLRWVWAVGDSDDETAQALLDLSHGYDVRVIVADSGIRGDDPKTRLRRLSVTANALWAAVQPDDDFVLVHESDIASPYELVPRMVERARTGFCPLAAWSVLEIGPGTVYHYDTWAVRKDGVRFGPRPPYHRGYRADRPFEVDSFGTVYLFEAADAGVVTMHARAVLDLCDGLRLAGRTLWLDPTLVVEQRRELWTAQIPAEV